VAQPNDAVDARLPPLPIGRLRAETLRIIGIGRLVHLRTGPWVVLIEDGSRVVRVDDGSEPSLFVEPPVARPAPAPPEPLVADPVETDPGADPGAADPAAARPAPAPSRAVMLTTPPRRRSGARPHRARPRRRSEQS
jgi:hypothetical protein